MENVNLTGSFDKDKATKIILEMYSVKEAFKSIDFKNEDSKEIQKKLKNVEKTLSSLEKDLDNIFNIEVSPSTKKMYLKLKEGDFGKELLEVVKYLE